MTALPDLAIYDMDRTLTRRGTYTRWLLFWAWRMAPWRLALLPAALITGALYLSRLVSRGRLKELNQALLMGSGARRDDVERLAAAFARRIVAHGLLPGAVAQLAADRAAGRRLVVATASYAFYAAAIARELGIGDVVATRSVWRGDRLTARIAGDNCYGPAKLAMVVAWRGTAAPPAHVRAYSDHISDAPLLAWSDEAVAATPSRALRELALARGWRIVDWRQP